MREIHNIRDVKLAFEWVDVGPELIVFLHGVGADRTAWSPQIEFFSQLGYSIASVDMRGSGQSQARYESGLAVPISISEFARDIDALVLDLGFDRAHWVGNSMGGVIIMEALAQNVTTIAKAVFCNTFAFHPQSKEILPRPARALKQQSLKDLSKVRIPAALRPDIDPDTLEACIQAMAEKDVETSLLSWRTTWSNDYRTKLPSVNLPSLVVTGSLDSITPPALGEEIAQLIPNAKYHLIEGAGHISNLDQPEEFNRVLLEFLRG